jgi:exopolyphosphatase/guanosine-5'-triphosphate,3'-diphosphate pyrophosphatase
MPATRIAVIDLGSNTFHLLICEVRQDRTWVTLHKEREYVKLASGGMDVINEDSLQRGIDAMLRFSNLIRQYDVEIVRAIGTAALRESKNGNEVAAQLNSITDIPIEIIDGDAEAEYILKGIRSVLPVMEDYGLIMDIGGGSVEFILFKADEVAFAQSFKIGVAVLYTMFHKGDPIQKEEIAALEKHLEETLQPLIEKLRTSLPYCLIGASGSFEVLYDVLPKKEVFSHWAELEAEGIIDYMDGVIRATLEERKMMPEIPVERLDYIVVAYLLIRFIFSTIAPDRLFYCEFALKEGVVAEMVEEINLD